MAEYYNLTLHHVQCDKSGQITDLEAPLMIIREVTPLMQKSVLPNWERSILFDGMWSSLKGQWLEERKDNQTVDAVPVVHSEWIPKEKTNTPYGLEMECAKCGFSVIVNDDLYFKFCPNCGARMDGKNGNHEKAD